jgi:S-adenosylmethionine uptake transporter
VSLSFRPRARTPGRFGIRSSRNDSVWRFPLSSSSGGSAALGVSLYLTGVFLFAINDALGKWLVMDYGVGQLMLLRSVGAAIVLAPTVWRRAGEILDFRQGWLMALRVAVTAIDSFAFYWATRYLPLADVMTFYMAAPLMATALSAIMLGERVEPFRWAAIGVGFVGVLIALRPTPELFTWASLISLFGAAMFALGQTFTRQLRQTHWLPIVFWQFIGAGFVGAATIPFGWVEPTPFDTALMFLVGIVSMFCYVCIARAFAFVRVVVLAPFQYSMILWATLMGYLVWGDVPTIPILVGNAIIIGSGLIVAAFERVRRVAPAAT